ncbi:MAG: hypothetical protein OK457_06005 [Thaumarchaeota archaeon]|nr:hypothetical protein [Nitrososphaerota archaeon]
MSSSDRRCGLWKMEIIHRPGPCQSSFGPDPNSLLIGRSQSAVCVLTDVPDLKEKLVLWRLHLLHSVRDLRYTKNSPIRTISQNDSNGLRERFELTGDAPEAPDHPLSDAFAKCYT